MSCIVQDMQARMPSDPFEAELLMMAEAVASGGHESDSESDVSDDDNCMSLLTLMCNLNSLSLAADAVINTSL